MYWYEKDYVCLTLNNSLALTIIICVQQVIGQEKRALGGFSNAAAMPHIGVLHYCDLVQSCPPSLRRKGKRNPSMFC